MKPNALKKLIAPFSNCELITYEFCKKLNLLVTQTRIQQQLEEHSNYPSLLSINDVLNANGVENISGRIDFKNISNLPVPFITPIKMEGIEYFTIVSSVDSGSITFLHPVTETLVALPFEDFEKLFTGIFLIAEKTEVTGEKEYVKNLKEEKRNQAFKLLAFFCIPALVILICTVCLIRYKESSIAPICYTIITSIGSLAGVLLLWYEIDKHNPVLQQICTGGKKTSCSAILTSDASKIVGISWSVIGSTYFIGSLISLLVSGIMNLPVLFILSWLNVLALPYIIFSIYYQSQIAKQWCVLCLTVQGIIALQFITAVAGGFHTISISYVQPSAVFAIAVSFIVTFLTLSLLLPALRSKKENRLNKNELQRLKHNPEIFDALLAKEKVITEPTEGLGIILGNPQATHKLIKVCNPYCAPCAKAHIPIEDLLENNSQIQLQIIFTATGEESDYRTPPVRHLLAIASGGDEMKTKKALDDWYLQEEKVFEKFADKYPMDGELQFQAEKLRLMDDWCNKMEITSTPTFFFNGHKLPSVYSVADLKYFLTV